jgi:hypothetical protein
MHLHQSSVDRSRGSLAGTRPVRRAAVALFGGLVVALLPAVAAAEEATPSLQSASIDVAMRSDDSSRLRATYRLSVASPEETVVPHRILPRGDSQLIRLEILGAGSVRRADATTYDVSLPGGASAYTLVAVSRAAEPGDVPVPVPDVPAVEQAQVDISVALPPGQRLVGDSLPSFTAQTRGGRTVLTHSGPAVPSAVVAPYGTSSVFSLGDLLTVLGLGVLAGSCLLWFRHGNRQARAAEGVEPPVDTTEPHARERVGAGQGSEMP